MRYQIIYTIGGSVPIDIFNDESISFDKKIFSRLCVLHEEFFLKDPSLLEPYIALLYYKLLENKVNVNFNGTIVCLGSRLDRSRYNSDSSANFEVIHFMYPIGNVLHVNALIVDRSRLTVFRFTPNGFETPYPTVTNQLKSFVSSTFPSFKLEEFPSTCFNLQSRFTCGQGICGIYALYAVSLFLLNPTWTFEEVYRYIGTNIEYKMYRVFVKLIEILEDIVKENKNDINFKQPDVFKTFEAFEMYNRRMGRTVMFMIAAKMVIHPDERLNEMYDLAISLESLY